MDTRWAACIVYFNDPIALNGLLDSLASQTLKPAAIFITDNNSKESPNINKNYDFEISVDKLSLNKGFGVGMNNSIKNAKKSGFTKFIVLSQDVLLSIDSAQKLISNLEVAPGIVFPTMIDRNTDKIFSQGGKINRFTGNIYLEYKKIAVDPDWADGSCLAIDLDTFENTIGFREDFFMYFEDVDFCYRAKKNGYSISHIDTRTSQTPNGPSPLLRSRNSIWFARSNQDFLLACTLTVRHFAGVIKYLVRLNPRYAIDRFHGITQGWGNSFGK